MRTTAVSLAACWRNAPTLVDIFLPDLPCDFVLNAAAPLFVSRQPASFMQVFQGSVGDCGDIFGRVPADHSADCLCVGIVVRSALSRLRGKRNTLSKCQQVLAGSGSQRLDCCWFTATSVGAG